MPPSRTKVNCPRCQQPILAQVEQIFDVTSDPGAKQRLLSGASNYAACPNCGFTGGLATPLIYHDADKELLLSYFPAELNMPANEQEKLIGSLINQVVNHLTPEKRKGYLLQPKSFLTYQSLIEHILGADGITPEMLKARQQQATLIQRLLSTSNAEARKEIIHQESGIIDGEFFALFNHLMETSITNGQEETAQLFDNVQKELLTESEYGKKISGQVKELEEAVKTLQAAGKELSREKLLDIMIDAPNDDRLSALVSMTRPALDYLFFQSLSELIETKTGAERSTLEGLREKLLDLTHQIDQRVEAEFKHASELLNKLIESKDIPSATKEHAGEITERFVQVLNRALQEAKKNKEEDSLKKLEQIDSTVKEMLAPPPEYELLQKLLEAPDEAALQKLLEENTGMITSEFSSFISSIMMQTETRSAEPAKAEEKQLMERLNEIYKSVLRFTMQSKMK